MMPGGLKAQNLLLPGASGPYIFTDEHESSEDKRFSMGQWPKTGRAAQVISGECLFVCPVVNVRADLIV